MEIKKEEKNKKIIFKPTTEMMTSMDNSLTKDTNKTEFDLVKFFHNVKDKIDMLYIDPSIKFDNSKLGDTNLKILSKSKDADYVIINNVDTLKLTKYNNKKFGLYKKITSNDDIEYLRRCSEHGVSFVIIDVDDWKIIPLENIIAILQNTGVEIFAYARSIEEVETLFTVLELGVDGVIVSTLREEDISTIHNLVKKTIIKLKLATIKEIKDVGIGERVCIDTVSMLSHGEGMLVGNRSNFLFLIHNESIGSSFTSPRPFRVNAGAVHCYTLTPESITKYLSELESGSKILIVNNKGEMRGVSVGRSKIETRPLKLFKATDKEGEIGSVIVQNAETIRFIGEDNNILPVTHAKIGDKILVHSIVATGRHFGMEVSKEYILEK